MKNLLLLLVMVFSFHSVAAQSFSIDQDQSSLKWTGKKVTGKHYGTISFESGKLEVKDGELVGGTFVVDMATITVEDLTGEWNQKLLKHLKSKDFFDVADFRKSTLKITNVQKADDDAYKVNGKLTIKNKTQPVSFKAKIDMEEGTIESEGGLVFDRTKYDIRYGSGKFFEDLGDKMIDDDVQLDFKVVAKNKEEKE